MKSAVNEAMLYTDDDGVRRYDLSKATEAAPAMADEATYHVARRQFGMTSDQVENLEGKTDPFGNSILSVVVESYVPTTGIERMLTDGLQLRDGTTTDPNTIIQLAIVSSYDQRILSNELAKELGDDKEALKSGIRNLRENYGFNSRDSTIPFGDLTDVNELRQAYLQHVMKARENVRLGLVSDEDQVDES